MGSLLLGPIYGGLIGGLSDLIGALAFPVGPYFIGFTLDNALIGVLPWLILYCTKRYKYAGLSIFALLFTFILAMLTVFFILYDQAKIFNHIIVFSPLIKAMIIIAYLLIFLIVMFFLYRYSLTKDRSRFLIIVSSCLACEVLVTALLASYWKFMLYNLPYMLNLGVALLILLINIPIKSTLIYLADKGVYKVNEKMKISLDLKD